MSDQHTLPVEGMACEGCEQALEESLETLDAVTRATADHEQATVEVVVSESIADEELATAIDDAGYDVPRNDETENA